MWRGRSLGLATPPWERRRPRRQVLAGVTRISQDSHSPKLVTPSRDGVARRTDGDVVDLVGVATPGSRTTEVTVQNLSPQAGIALPVPMRAVVVNAMGRRGRRRSQDHAAPTASLRVPRCSPSRCPGRGPGVTTRARIPVVHRVIDRALPLEWAFVVDERVQQPTFVGNRSRW